MSPFNSAMGNKFLYYLPSGFYSFPNAKVTDDPGQKKTQSQIPANTAKLLDTSCDIQNSSPANHTCSYNSAKTFKVFVIF